MKQSKSTDKKKLNPKDKPTRTKTSLYLSKEIWAEFKVACGLASPSKVMEKLMKDFIENSK